VFDSQWVAGLPGDRRPEVRRAEVDASDGHGWINCLVAGWGAAG
jgi:hypothetical protein